MKKTTWLYPPQWDGEYYGPDGDDQFHGWRRMRVNFLYQDESANGTDETGVHKIYREDLYGLSGQACRLIQIDRIQYITDGMVVRIYYNMNPNQLITILPDGNEGTIMGPFKQQIDGVYAEGETGDVVFSTDGSSQYDMYNITMDIQVIE